jgi:hypothetical protein
VDLSVEVDSLAESMLGPLVVAVGETVFVGCVAVGIRKQNRAESQRGADRLHAFSGSDYSNLLVL